MTLIHAPKVTKIICPPLPGHIIRPPFHNGSKIRDSVPLWRPLSPCTLSTGPVRHLPSVLPFHNGSKTRDSVLLRKPLSVCYGSHFAKRHKLRALCCPLELQILRCTSSCPALQHTQKRVQGNIRIVAPSICNEPYCAKRQKLRALCRLLELKILRCYPQSVL